MLQWQKPHLAFLGVSRDIPSERNCRTRSALFVLRRVVHAHFPEIEQNIFCQAFVAGCSPARNSGDEDFFHFYFDVLDRIIPAGFPHGEQRVVVMRTVTTGQH